MSGSGNCFDNALMESFWGIIKQELINHRHYRTRQEAIEDITDPTCRADAFQYRE
jgi:putative transposase